jgi:hypothetical protein
MKHLKKIINRKKIILFLDRLFSSIIRGVEKFLYPNKKIKNIKTTDIAFILSTYDPRIINSTLPLIRDLKTIFPDIPLNIIVNKDKNNQADWDARKSLLKEVEKYNEIYLIMNNRPMGLAHNWNKGIYASLTNKMIILNDDIKILEFENFKSEVNLLAKSLEKEDLIRVNYAYHFFGISSNCIKNIGFFDERFLYINFEDSDYQYRYENFYKKEPLDMFFRSFLHTNDEKDKVQLGDGLVHSLLNKKILDTMYKDDSEGIIGIFDKKKKKIVEELSLYPLYTLLVENSDIIQEFEKYSNQFKKYLTNKNNKKDE